jgi:hypothetical protein
MKTDQSGFVDAKTETFRSRFGSEVLDLLQGMVGEPVKEIGELIFGEVCQG